MDEEHPGWPAECGLQSAINPATGKLVPGGIAYEAPRAMDNVQAIVQSVAGFTMHDVTECVVLMANISEYGAFNAVYAKYFDAEPPARAAVEVARRASAGDRTRSVHIPCPLLTVKLRSLDRAVPLDARVEVKCSAAA